MPADIRIASKEGKLMLELESEDRTTIADIIRNHGPGSLRREDGVMKLSPNFVIKAGNYSWIPAHPPDEEGKTFGSGFAVSSQEQQSAIPLAYQPVVEFAKQQIDKHTEGRAFSKAGYTWARLLLSERGIQVRTNEINLEDGQGAEPQRFLWTVETKDN
mmetsp:Transcript_13279/g.19531  ORF Transcript_13279/g.19531 Transcript_13279/m.19531 type:complete len:159 (+) Transcript_13279:131-607(+)